MDTEKALKIHDVLWQHVSFANICLSDKIPEKLEHSLFELCEAEKIVSELSATDNGNGTSTHHTTIDERLIAAIFVACNYEPDSKMAIVSYPKSHLVLVERKK